MIWTNGFTNNTISCNASREVDLDRLNLLASGDDRNLCGCSYRVAGRKHVFSYQTDGMLPLREQQVVFDDTVTMLESVRPLLAPGVLHPEHLRITRECVFRDGAAYRFVYLPLMPTKTVPVREVLSKLISLLRLRDDRLTELLKKLKTGGDAQALACLDVFLYTWGHGDASEAEAETTLLDQADTEAETTLLDQADTEAETTLLDQNDTEAETTLLDQNDTEAETTLLDQTEAEPEAAAPRTEPPVGRSIQPSAASEGETTVLGLESLHDDDFLFSEYPELSISRVTAYMYGDAEEHETMPLTSGRYVSERQPVRKCSGSENLFLIRSATGERIHVHSTPFTIGKNAELVDYLLLHDSVSRVHATIHYEQDHYYIMDERSTNGTVVEGIQLRPMEKMELGNGYLIALGSEFFQARIERR